MNKQALLVLGPESSGNRFLTRLLVAAGCQGVGAHVQPWDTHPPTTESPIVWLRSMPHAHDWDYLDDMVRYLRREWYGIYAVLIARSFPFCQQSQVVNGHTTALMEATMQTEWAWKHLVADLDRLTVPFVVLTYEGLVQHTDAIMVALATEFDLTWDAATSRAALGEAVYDGNAPYARDILYAQRYAKRSTGGSAC